jgi:hypothetical protein
MQAMPSKEKAFKMGDALDEIFEQASLRANEGTRRGGKGYRFNLSLNLEHTAVQREKKKASAPAPSDGKPKAPSTVSKRNSANLGRLIPDYRTLVETCRAPADELELSRLEIDRLGGLPTGMPGNCSARMSVQDADQRRCGRWFWNRYLACWGSKYC